MSNSYNNYGPSLSDLGWSHEDMNEENFKDIDEQFTKIKSQLAILREFAEKIAEYECYVTCDCQMDAKVALKKCFGEEGEE